MTTQPTTTDITQDDKLWAGLGYFISIIAIIMLFIEGKKNRPFIKFHAVQSVALAVVYAIFAIVVGVIATIIGFFTFGIGGFIGCIIPIVGLVLLWPAILAYQGKYFEIPVITKFIRDQHWV